MLLMCNLHGAVSGNSNINVALSLHCSITNKFYVLNFCRFLLVFTKCVLAKILLPWQKPNTAHKPWTW